MREEVGQSSYQLLQEGTLANKDIENRETELYLLSAAQILQQGLSSRAQRNTTAINTVIPITQGTVT